jgi:hypothetical protein
MGVLQLGPLLVLPRDLLRRLPSHGEEFHNVHIVLSIEACSEGFDLEAFADVVVLQPVRVFGWGNLSG